MCICISEKKGISSQEEKTNTHFDFQNTLDILLERLSH